MHTRTYVRKRMYTHAHKGALVLVNQIAGNVISRYRRDNHTCTHTCRHTHTHAYKYTRTYAYTHSQRKAYALSQVHTLANPMCHRYWPQVSAGYTHMHIHTRKQTYTVQCTWYSRVVLAGIRMRLDIRTHIHTHIRIANPEFRR